MGQEGENHYDNSVIHDFIESRVGVRSRERVPEKAHQIESWLKRTSSPRPQNCSWNDFCYGVARVGHSSNWVGKDDFVLPGGGKYRVKKLIERTIALNEAIKNQSRDLDMQKFLENAAEKHPIITDLNLVTMIVSLD